MAAPCPGPMIWYDDQDIRPGALLECACCGYLVVAGSFFDARHTRTPLPGEGLSG
jgi:hypothetical protein